MASTSTPPSLTKCSDTFQPRKHLVTPFPPLPPGQGDLPADSGGTPQPRHDQGGVRHLHTTAIPALHSNQAAHLPSPSCLLICKPKLNLCWWNGAPTQPKALEKTFKFPFHEPNWLKATWEARYGSEQAKSSPWLTLCFSRGSGSLGQEHPEPCPPSSPSSTGATGWKPLKELWPEPERTRDRWEEQLGQSNHGGSVEVPAVTAPSTAHCCLFWAVSTYSHSYITHQQGEGWDKLLLRVLEFILQHQFETAA